MDPPVVGGWFLSWVGDGACRVSAPPHPAALYQSVRAPRKEEGSQRGSERFRGALRKIDDSQSARQTTMLIMRAHSMENGLAVSSLPRL